MHLYLASKLHGLIQPASTLAGFFVSSKGGDGYVDRRGGTDNIRDRRIVLPTYYPRSKLAYKAARLSATEAF